MEDAAARKARLRALREEAAAADQAGEDGQPREPQEPQEPQLKFRNYAPKDEKIEHQKVSTGPPEGRRACPAARRAASGPPQTPPGPVWPPQLAPPAPRLSTQQCLPSYSSRMPHG